MRASYIADEALAVSSSSTPLTAATYAGCNVAFIECQTAAVRFAVDGGTPTATLGHVLEVGDALTLDSPDQLQKFRAIRRDGADAVLHCSYGRGD